MTEITTIVVCVDSGALWRLDEDAACTDPGHQHIHHELHSHRSPVFLPDGTGLVAVSYDEADPYGRDATPAFGLYLDQRWQPPWPHALVDWPDFGVPDDPEELLAGLRDLLARARTGDLVEIGCLGGHGRTGTALACLAVLVGHPPAEAVGWVRATYCADAVETDEQMAFVDQLEI
jgi:hypothetical protein